LSPFLNHLAIPSPPFSNRGLLHSCRLQSLHKQRPGKVRLLFPSAELGLAKYDGRAEALLLAYYARGRFREAAT